MVKQQLEGVLFVCCTQDLMDRLDKYLDEQRKEKPWQSITRADVVRELLYKMIEERDKK